jgi:hypothetical protein
MVTLLSLTSLLCSSARKVTRFVLDGRGSFHSRAEVPKLLYLLPLKMCHELHAPPPPE